MSKADPSPRLIAGVLYEGALSLDLIGPIEAFSFARLELAAQNRRSYEIVLAAPDAGPVETVSGVRLCADKTLNALEGVDTLIVPGMRTGDYRYRESGVIEWLRAAAPGIRRIACICSGAFIGAEAGLLAGRAATTHWMDCAELRELCPTARVEENRIFVKDGGVYSSGGVTAGIDLALALIEEDFGRPLALKVARRMVLFLKRQGGQVQFSDLLQAQIRSTRFATLIDWIEEALAMPLNVERLAEKAGMSPRNFARQFEAETGASPMKYVSARRLERARLLLEDSATPLGAIARETGFSSDERLRRAFQRALGVSPRDYRDRFGPE